MAIFEFYEYSFFLQIFQVFWVDLFSLCFKSQVFEAWVANGWFKVDLVGDV